MANQYLAASMPTRARNDYN